MYNEYAEFLLERLSYLLFGFPSLSEKLMLPNVFGEK